MDSRKVVAPALLALLFVVIFVGVVRAQTPETHLQPTSPLGMAVIQVVDQFGAPSPRTAFTVTSPISGTISGFTLLGEKRVILPFGEATFSVEGISETKTIYINQVMQYVSFQRTYALPDSKWLKYHYRGIMGDKQAYGIYIDYDQFYPLHRYCQVFYLGAEAGEWGGCSLIKVNAHVVLLEPGLQEVTLVATHAHSGHQIVVTREIEVEPTSWMTYAQEQVVNYETAEYAFWLDEEVQTVDGAWCEIEVQGSDTAFRADPCPVSQDEAVKIQLPEGDNIVSVEVTGPEKQSTFEVLVPVVINFELLMPQINNN